MDIPEINIESGEYNNNLNELLSILHSLEKSFDEAKENYLVENGYQMLEIDGVEILIPKGMNFNQLYNYLQQMPVPESRSDSYIKYYFVSKYDLKNCQDSTRYKKIVRKRKELLNKVNKIYKNYYKNELSDKNLSDKEIISNFNDEFETEISRDILEIIK